MKIIMWTAHGGQLSDTYGFGCWTGEQGDLLCVKKCSTNQEAEKFLSPMHTNIICAFVLFLIRKYFKKGE